MKLNHLMVKIAHIFLNVHLRKNKKVKAKINLIFKLVIYYVTISEILK